MSKFGAELFILKCNLQCQISLEAETFDLKRAASQEAEGPALISSSCVAGTTASFLDRTLQCTILCLDLNLIKGPGTFVYLRSGGSLK